MHTFFINTSGNELIGYEELLEVQYETRSLVSLDCPINAWMNEDKGYKSYVSRMGDLIDSYKEINNSFNLIVYVDLISCDVYTSIPQSDHRERYACLQALYSVFTRYIKETLVRELSDCGREPCNTVIVFEENKKPLDGQRDTSDDGKKMLLGYYSRIMGLPDGNEIQQIISGNADAEEALDTKGFVDLLCKRENACGLAGLLSCYEDTLDTLLKEARGYSEDPEVPVRRFADNVSALYDSDSREIKGVSFVTNRRAGIVNKRENARRSLRMCVYLLDCIYAKSVLSGESAYAKDCEARQFFEFDEKKWDALAAAFDAKRRLYSEKHKQAQGLSERFSDIDLAPKIFAFDNEKFGLDEFGAKLVELAVMDDERERGKEDKKKKSETEKENNGEVSVTDNAKVMVAADKKERKLFSDEEYAEFDYDGFGDDSALLDPERATAEQYIEKAKILRLHHLNYLKKLKVHTTDVLSNYAGRSEENEAATLKKRKVSIAEDDFEDQGREYRYAKAGRPEEKQKLKTVKDISNTAYETVRQKYLDFCAGRSVAVADIEEQCNWFVTRIHQIEASIRRIKTVAVGLLFAILLLYAPFLIIQWEAIFDNIVTLTYALFSIIIPVLVLYGVFAVMSVLQRRRFAVEWKKLKEMSAKALEENKIAAKKFDMLLAAYIPGVRWLYEYKTDVEFYLECCKMARAKIGHHSQKLHDRVVAIGNILEDLECDMEEIGESGVRFKDDLDYNLSYCSGKANREFYSIIDGAFLASLED